MPHVRGIVADERSYCNRSDVPTSLNILKSQLARAELASEFFSQFSPFAIFQMDDVISGWEREDGAHLAFATIFKGLATRRG